MNVLLNFVHPSILDNNEFYSALIGDFQLNNAA